MYQLFHIGIPKSGTTSIQQTLDKDPRIHLTRSRFFTGKEWWSNNRPALPPDKVIVESNETLVSGGFQKVKLAQVVSRLYQTNPEAQVVLTIRKQEDALISMFKYHIKHNFSGTRSLDNWLYNTNLGIDYASCCMYGMLVKTIASYFPKEQIHVLFFEDLRDNSNIFYGNFYKQIGIPFEEKYIPSEIVNAMTLSDNALYTLRTLNQVSSSKKNAEGFKGSNSFNGKGQKLKRRFASTAPFKAPQNFFNLQTVTNYNELMQDFKRTNNVLVDLGYTTASALKKYGYIL